MIIPVRCFTCGNILADKELAYRKLVEDAAESSSSTSLPFMYNLDDIYSKSVDELKSVQGKALDKLCVFKMCCRRHMLTSVDCLEDI